MSEFTLEFQNSAEDYRSFCREIAKSCRRRNSPLWHRWAVRVGLWAILVGYFAIFNPPLMADGVLTTLFVILALFIIVVVLQARQCFASMKPYTDGSFASKWTYKYSEDGVRAEAPSEVTQYQWSAFKHLEELDLDFFLYVDNSAAIKIPKSAFAGEEEASRWRAFCESRIAAARA